MEYLVAARALMLVCCNGLHAQWWSTTRRLPSLPLHRRRFDTAKISRVLGIKPKCVQKTVQRSRDPF